LDMGEFKGYVCRTTDKHVEKRRKYLYNKGFSRKDTISGDYGAKTIVLCEGHIDRVKLNQFGLKHVGAILGWKLSNGQLEKLKKQGVENVISALDMDKPGQEGTEYLKKFFNVIRFQFPRGAKDPGDLDENSFR